MEPLERHWFKPNGDGVHPGASDRVRRPGHVPGAAGSFRFADLRFSGFYAWLKEPVSRRAQDDVRKTDLIRQAGSDSGKV
jgi:hypothetical protein